MKKFIFGFIAALALVALIYFGYPLIRGFQGDSGPVAPEQLNPDAKEFGELKVGVFSGSQPLAGVEVDLGKIGPSGPVGAMSAVKTDSQGTALFQKVPVGAYDIFWNLNAFPGGYSVPSNIPVEILKDKITEKRVELIRQ